MSVSVLFSEPKIPQFSGRGVPCRALGTVSVLFSEPKIPQFRSRPAIDNATELFQCSSASRKFLNWNRDNAAPEQDDSVSVLFSEPKIPQFGDGARTRWAKRGFSALQRAENSSIQTRYNSKKRRFSVSVLFSEPKIPQLRFGVDGFVGDNPFQCSSASRKFLNSSQRCASSSDSDAFQCSSASRKFLNSAAVACA